MRVSFLVSAVLVDSHWFATKPISPQKKTLYHLVKLIIAPPMSVSPNAVRLYSYVCPLAQKSDIKRYICAQGLKSIEYVL